jgi:HK97 gp10 family phage protein
VRVGTNVEYAAPLEFGTTRMAPRPFMRPAIVMSQDKVSDEVIAVLRVGNGGQ